MVGLRQVRQTYQAIAATAPLAPSKVGHGLQRADLNRPAESVLTVCIQRYERKATGDLPYLDIKKPGRFSLRGTA